MDLMAEQGANFRFRTALHYCFTSIEAKRVSRLFSGASFFGFKTWRRYSIAYGMLRTERGRIAPHAFA
jgi:hypothetical protein